MGGAQSAPVSEKESEPEEEESKPQYARLEFTDREILPKNTKAYQIDDGTIFYHYHITDMNVTTKEKLYVEWRGGKVEAKLPYDRLYDVTAHGEALYFTTVRENTYSTYRATFTAPSAIVITNIRVSDKEYYSMSGTCKLDNGDSCYLYRIYDDPAKDKIHLSCKWSDVPCNIQMIHKGRLVYEKSVYSSEFIPCVSKWSDSEIVVKGDFSKYFCDDSSPFIYLTAYISSSGLILFVLDTRLMRFLPGLVLPSFVFSILSIRNGQITVEIEKNDIRYLATAQLPKGYFVSFGEEQNEFESEFLEKFEIRRVLGQGAFGCVFEARNKIDECSYAVKKIPFRGSDNEVKEALKEVRTLAALKHEGIVGYNSSWIEKPPEGWQRKVDDELVRRLGIREKFVYTDDCVFIYIQMELCKQSLHDWLYSNKTRDLARAKAWFKQLVSAVGYLHLKQKIHRDLKPCNILFDGEGRLKICDLGLAAERAMRNGQEFDMTRTVAGTPMYMAPEQWNGKYTAKVDIFSLGLILAELCVCMTIQEAYEAFTNYRQGRATRILKKLPEVDQFVSWLTNVDPTSRPNCDEILAHKFLA